MKYVVLLSILLLPLKLIYSQTEVLLEIYTATDYILTPEYPRYNYYGYDNQFGIRYGAGVSVKILNKFRLGIGAERYTRKEDYECVHFPNPDSFPQRTWEPLINNPNFSCDYRTTSRISFLEIPISLRYDFIQAKKINAFASIGYGYQFVTSRKTTLVDLQSGMETTDDKKSISLRSSNAFRISSGVAKSISKSLELELELSYRSDSFQFNYQSIGVSLGVNYTL